MSSELPADRTPEQTEASLSAYAPRPPRIDRDRLMFEAGRAAAFSHFPVSTGSPFRRGAMGWFPLPAAGSPSQWLWPASTFVMTVVACGLTVALCVRIEPIERVQVIQRVTREPHGNPPHVNPPGGAPAVVSVSSNRLHHGEPLSPPGQPAEESLVLTVADLPENHILRVRQVALTQGVESLAAPDAERSPRLSPPPTRGSLMRKIVPKPAASASSPALFRWSAWSTSE